MYLTVAYKKQKRDGVRKKIHILRGSASTLEFLMRSGRKSSDVISAVSVIKLILPPYMGFFCMLFLAFMQQ